MAAIHVVFLQGMPSPFFRQMGAQLAQRGCRVTRINLCLGDWLFWPGPHSTSYRGRYADWTHFIAAFFDQHQVSDLVLLGEQRRYHKEAVLLAQQRGIRVMANDFGYLRPDWITLERDGMGGNSRFPRDPHEILRRSAGVGNADLVQRYRDSALGMMACDLLYNFSNLLFGILYPHYRRTDCRPHTLVYTLASAKHLALAKLRRSKSRRTVEELLSSKSGYFVLPLQLDHDFQIVAYSPFGGMLEVMRAVLQSFARCADPGAQLVIKVHPWDAGLVNWERAALRVSKEFSVADRIIFLDGGDLDALSRHALGMVTVNSTAGLHAMQVGCPVKVLGQAVYDVEGLTFQGPLDDFWSLRRRPDATLLNAFVNLMAATVQIRGVFFSEPGRTAAVQAAVQKLESGFESASDVHCPVHRGSAPGAERAQPGVPGPHAGGIN